MHLCLCPSEWALRSDTLLPAATQSTPQRNLSVVSAPNSQGPAANIYKKNSGAFNCRSFMPGVSFLSAFNRYSWGLLMLWATPID